MTAKKKPAEKLKKGRHTKYDPEFHPFMAWSLAIMGKTAKEIAKGLRISTGTLDSWQRTHPDFLSSIQAGRGVADSHVEQALYKRAIGYDFDYTETTNDSEKGTTVKKCTKHISPDVNAQRLWLLNRKPEAWRDKQEIEHSGTISWLDLMNKCLPKK